MIFWNISGCKITVYLATGTAVIVEPDKGSPINAKELLQLIVESEELALPPYAAEVFSLWMASSFLGTSNPHDSYHNHWNNAFSSYYLITRPRLCVCWKCLKIYTNSANVLRIWKKCAIKLSCWINFNILLHLPKWKWLRTASSTFSTVKGLFRSLKIVYLILKLFWRWRG